MSNNTKQIRLIDDPETESIETTDDGEGLSSAEKQKLMKTHRSAVH